MVKKRGRLARLAGFLAVNLVAAGTLVMVAASTPADAATTTPPPTTTINGTTWVQVSTAPQLMYIDENGSTYQSDNIELMNNINLSGYVWAPFVAAGSINGDGHVITNLDIADESVPRGGIDAGFISDLYGTVENLGLVNATVTEEGPGGGVSDIGTLVGFSDGTIDNVFATGTLSSNIGAPIGGLVGWLGGGRLENSYTDVSVNTTAANASVGGLVGESGGSIVDSYAIGPVTGTGTKGGLVGDHGGTITASYFDTETTGQSGNGGESTSNMQNRSTYANWNFSTVWAMAAGVNNGFPYLQWQSTIPTILTTSLPESAANVAYDATLAVAGGFGPYTWTIASGSLPDKMNLATNGVISGTPITGGSTTFTVRVKDVDGASATQALTLDIATAPTITTTALPSAVMDTTYDQTLAATGGTAPYTWTVIAGALPHGLTLSSTGVLSGTPTALGSTSFTIQAKDAGGLTASQQFGLTVMASASPPTTTINGMTWVQVSTAPQLMYIDENRSTYQSANIELMNNINLSGYVWAPFAAAGIINGDGHVITNLDIADESVPRGGLEAGFISYLYGTVENLGLVNATVTEEGPGGGVSDIGTLVGVSSDGTIDNVFATGTLSSNLGAPIGGLVGWLGGGRLENSYTDVSVNTTAANASVGGLVGESGGSIVDSYAIGPVTGTGTKGGLVGDPGGTITASYFDTETTGQSGSGGESTSNMQKEATYANWNFSTVWAMAAGVNNGFPYLQAVPPSGTPLPTGQMPEVPWAAGVPAVGVAIGLWWWWRRQYRV